MRVITGKGNVRERKKIDMQPRKLYSLRNLVT